MPTYVRATMFMQLRNSGWSESWYFDNTDLDKVRLRFAPIISARLACASHEVLSIGSRYGFVNSPHAAFSLFNEMQDPGGFAADSSYQSAYFTAYTGSQQKRQVILRGFPDAQVVQGAYASVGTMPTRIAAFFQTLQSQGALIRSKNLANPLVGVVSVSGGGVVTTFTDLGPSVGDQVKFFRTRDTTNHSVGLVYNVAAVTSPSSFTLANWPAGRLVTKGQIQLLTYVYAPIASYLGPRKIISRKVGRPFGQPVGRRRVRT